MANTASIRYTEEPREILEMVFRSLETQRSAKTEDEVVAAIAEQFDLPHEAPESWPALVISRGVPVEHVLDFLLRLLAPFVAMIVEIYEFVQRYASTTGGRTEHFALDSGALDEPWTFDTSNMPRLLRVLRQFRDVILELVDVDWSHVGELLRIDNGIFYGSIENERLIHSLIVHRSRGRLAPELRQIGSDLREALQRVLSAWLFGRLEEEGERQASQVPVFVPGWAAGGNDSSIGVVLDAALGPAGYSLSEAFVPLDPAKAIPLEDTDNRWTIDAAALFCALWGLEDGAFTTAAAHRLDVERHGPVMDSAHLRARGPALGRRLIAEVRQSVRPTGEKRRRRELFESKVETLLLPYWKDRWFLYEVWTLLQPLSHFLAAGASLELLGIQEIEQSGVRGTTWNLPTQKAAEPVARLTGPGGGRLLIWFQRETRRLDSERAMEPDVRVTFPWSPYPDLAIVECKDRVQFKSGGRKVLQSYLDGSSAREVWLVNYEPLRSSTGLCEIVRDGERRSGLVERFRPGSVPHEFHDALREWGELFLGLGADTTPEASVLIVDTSGSMYGKTLPRLPVFSEFVPHRQEAVWGWADDVRQVDKQLWQALAGDARQFTRTLAGGFENASALHSFAVTLPPDARLVLVTDYGGRDSALAVLERSPGGSEPTYRIAGRMIEIWCVEDFPA